MSAIIAAALVVIAIGVLVQSAVSLYREVQYQTDRRRQLREVARAREEIARQQREMIERDQRSFVAIASHDLH